MAGLAELMGLQMPGAAAADAGMVQPQTGADWDAALKDPVMKSALLGFGMQLMTGGRGSPVQRVGEALGAGASSAAGTAKSINDFQGEERARKDKLSEGAASRAQSETNARIGADSRQEVAQIRSEAMLQRAAMIGKPQNSQEMGIYSKAMADYMKKEKDNQILSRKSDQQIGLEADAWAKSVLDNARNATGVRSQGSPLPDAGDATSGGGPGPAGTTGSVTLGAGGTPPAKGTAAPVKPAAPSIQELIQSYDSSKGAGAFRQSFANSETRKGLRARGYDTDVSLFERLWNLPSTQGVIPLQNDTKGMETGAY